MLLFADPASGQLVSETVWRDPHARAARPSVAEMIRAEVLDEDDCEIRRGLPPGVQLRAETGPGLVVNALATHQALPRWCR